MPFTTSAAYDALDPFTQQYLLPLCELLTGILEVDLLTVPMHRLVGVLLDNIVSTEFNKALSAMPKAFNYVMQMRIKEPDVDLELFKEFMEHYSALFDQNKSKNLEVYFNEMHTQPNSSTFIPTLRAHLGDDFFTLPMKERVEKINSLKDSSFQRLLFGSPQLAIEFFYITFANTKEDEASQTAAFTELKSHRFGQHLIAQNNLLQFFRHMNERHTLVKPKLMQRLQLFSNRQTVDMPFRPMSNAEVVSFRSAQSAAAAADTSNSTKIKKG